MRIELAGVPVEIVFHFGSNRSAFTPFLTDKEPLFTVEPTDADLLRTQNEYDRMAEADGVSAFKHSRSTLENAAIHSLLAEKLVSYGVLLMHGSALAIDGEAVIFTAPSGTGKSTHAGLWREVFGDRVQMVNDDKPMLRFTDGGVLVYGTPWLGKHRLGGNVSAPLKAIVSLARGSGNSIVPLAKAAAFPVLLRQIYASEDPAVMARILELERRLLTAVDFYDLHCDMSPDAARVAYLGITGRE